MSDSSDPDNINSDLLRLGGMLSQLAGVSLSVLDALALLDTDIHPRYIALLENVVEFS